MIDTVHAVKHIKAHLADREWRMDNLYYVQNKAGEKVLFVRNESQRMFWDDMWFLNIILKDRQRGFSTLIAIFMLDYCLFNSESAAGIIDITMDDAEMKLKKMAYAYENLPPWLKELKPLIVNNARKLEWSNKSSARCGTSHRGGTLQLLHISEKGKIACRFPERAREIRTGALNTLAAGQFVFEESTAEGNAGEFYDDCQRAKEIADSGRPLTSLDFKFHFFGWWMGSENEMDPEYVSISVELEKYFTELEAVIGVKLSDRKKAWYSKKSEQQKEDMKREFPGTPEEAFESAIQGAYLAKQISKIIKKGQVVDNIPFEPGVPVNTGWDYGLNDAMTIWLHQRVKFEDRILAYRFGTDDDVTYYWSELQKDFDCVWGYHFLPHDFAHRRGGTAKDAASPPRTLENILNDAGMRNTYIVPITNSKESSIAESRAFLLKCFISKSTTAAGWKCLKNFRREWDGNNGCWRNTPKHDWAMHGYDGFESLARGLSAYGTMALDQSEIMTKLPAPSNWRAR